MLEAIVLLVFFASFCLAHFVERDNGLFSVICAVAAGLEAGIILVERILR